MLNFVKNAFSKFMEVILWVNLIVCTIGGGIIGGDFGKGYAEGSAGIGLLGAGVGLLIGVLTNIVGGGFIATILDINSQLNTLISKGMNIDNNVDRYLCALVNKGTNIEKNVKTLVDRNANSGE